MVDIIHRLGIKADISKVYAAIGTVDGVARWWTKETSGSAKVGETFNLCFRDTAGNVIGEMTMEIAKLVRDQEVHWLVKAGPPEWIGTTISFELSQQKEFTILLFGHRNWKEAVEFTAHCSMKWAVFLLSLRDYVESGKGRPSPNDIKIDNWN